MAGALASGPRSAHSAVATWPATHCCCLLSPAALRAWQRHPPGRLRRLGSCSALPPDWPPLSCSSISTIWSRCSARSALADRPLRQGTDMALLVAAVTVVGALGVVNLIFSLGVIRRLREHTEILDRLAAGGGAQGESVMLRPGETVGDFVATTMDGERVSRGALVGSTLVGFFSPDCAPCEERLPEFVDHAEHHPGGRRQVLAVIVAQDEDT